jgi:hypothetical protein
MNNVNEVLREENNTQELFQSCCKLFDRIIGNRRSRKPTQRQIESNESSEE